MYRLFRGEIMGKIVELVGSRIREYRKGKGLSQEELAHRAELHTAHLGRIERGEKNPTLESIEKIVNALGITFEELFSFEDIPSTSEKPIIEKIVSYLMPMSDEEQNDTLKLVRILSEWKDRTKK